MTHNTLRLNLQSIHFDRITTRRMNGYVVGLAQRNIAGEAQLYVSPSSFRVQRDGRIRTRDDEVFRWDGDGETIFATPLEGVETVGLDLYFVRDNQNLRDVGAILTDVFGKDGAGADLADAIATALTPIAPAAGAVVTLLPPAARVVGGLLKSRKDRVKIFGSGNRDLATIADDLNEDGVFMERWSRNTADRGYFEIEWELATMADPTRGIRPILLPDTLLERFAA